MTRPHLSTDADAALLTGNSPTAEWDGERFVKRKPKWTRAEVARTNVTIERMWRDGSTIREIATALGMTPDKVNGRVRKMGGRPEGKRRGGLSAQFFAFVSPEPNSGCWLWTGSVDRKGYGQIRVTGKRLRYATHVSLDLVGRPLPAGMVACHRCDNPACVNPEHLFHGTMRDNTLDMVAKGRNSPPPVGIGSKNGSAKITEGTARAIKESLASGMTARAIAALHDAPYSAVVSIRQGKTWRHV